ncbi:hypothetical protein C8Q73DRAFT_783450 [Cubamyces lactineus]|nr:hypothetical protein C8Q73DRAFT_783450 [Cubamyces lactineus]
MESIGAFVATGGRFIELNGAKVLDNEGISRQFDRQRREFHVVSVLFHASDHSILMPRRLPSRIKFNSREKRLELYGGRDESIKFVGNLDRFVQDVADAVKLRTHLGTFQKRLEELHHKDVGADEAATEYPHTGPYTGTYSSAQEAPGNPQGDTEDNR